MTPDIETLIERLEGLRVELEERDRPHSARLVEETQSALRAVQWRPISEAPKDGTRFLFTNGADVVGTGMFIGPSGRVFAADSWQGSRLTEPTAFMPLPAARASKEG